MQAAFQSLKLDNERSDGEVSEVAQRLRSFNPSSGITSVLTA